MLERLPRILGGFALAYTFWMVPTVYIETTPVMWGLFVTAWIATAVVLVSGRQPTIAAAALAVLATIGVFWPNPPSTETSAMLAWVALIVAVTGGRMDERATLLRWLAVSVYVFTAAAKINPPFLAGDQLVHLVDTRAHLEPLRGLIEPYAPQLALLVIATEAAMAPLLFWPVTRRAVIACGVVLHLTFAVLAALDFPSLLLLLTLNGLLVMCYAGFTRDVTEEAASPAPSRSPRASEAEAAG